MNRAERRDLSREEIIGFLASHSTGRVVFGSSERTYIEISNYAYAYGWIYTRTGNGAELTAMVENKPIVFQVDEFDGQYDWRSVVVRGHAERLNWDEDAPDRFALEEGLTLLRAVCPTVFRSGDPSPESFAVFRVHLDEIHGEASSTKAHT